MHDRFRNNSAVTIQGSVYSVRAALDRDETVYSVSDIVGLLGVTYPNRWISAKRKNYEKEFRTRKLLYPVESQGQIRTINMVFADRDTVEWIINYLPGYKEAKNWIRKEVLTYKIEQSENYDTMKDDAEEPRIAGTQPSEMDDNLDAMFDKLLFDIVELKRIIKNRRTA